ncbi:MAG: hypothetical protein AAF674_16150 [Pseudomonadota bacterium]
MTRIVHFLLHVPKCAGTTVEAHFESYLGPYFAYAPRWENVLRNVLGNRYHRREVPDYAEILAVSGHSLSQGMSALFPGAEIRPSVLLRDPAGYLLSFYNYRWTRHSEGWGPEPPPFKRWYASQRRNPISRFLMNRYFEVGVPTLYRFSSAGRLAFLEKRLADFHFVGSYRHAGELIAGISDELGITDTVANRNVTPVKKLIAADLSIEMRRRIERDNVLDQALFDRWADRKWSGVPEGPPPDLPTNDQASYMTGDALSGIRKKLIA